MELRRSAEDYLEAIYVIKRQKGAVRSIDVAHHLNYSKPSVSRAVNNLKADGYLEMAPSGELTLTAKGEKAAYDVYERHTVLTELFVSIGVPRTIAAADACRVEHQLSTETFAALKATHKERLEGLQAAPDAPAEKDGDKKKKKKKKSK